LWDVVTTARPHCTSQERTGSPILTFPDCVIRYLNVEVNLPDNVKTPLVPRVGTTLNL